MFYALMTRGEFSLTVTPCSCTMILLQNYAKLQTKQNYWAINFLVCEKSSNFAPNNHIKVQVIMDLLKERIMQEGRCFPGGILKVDSFVNHQMDPILMMDLAKEFVRLFKDIKYNKIITIEASGIAPAIMVGYLTNLPVVFVKKKQPKTMEGMITSVVHSFTKDRDYTVCVSNSYLTPEDHVIFIDDFLANGNASKGVMDLCEKAGAKIEAMGFIIEKAFQHGGDFLRKEGIRYEALATVESLDDCKIVLK